MSGTITVSGWCVTSKGMVISELYATKKHAEAHAAMLACDTEVIFYEAETTADELRAQLAEYVEDEVVETYISEHKT